jgi:hypothetical protein
MSRCSLAQPRPPSLFIRMKDEQEGATITIQMSIKTDVK